MTKEQQDLVWACLPKVARDEIKERYKTLSTSFLTGRYMELNNLFGHHNLTSDTEPEEMLMTPRKKVLEYYKDVQQAIGEENGDTRIEMEGRKWAMLYFFGDKCQPDNPNTPNSGELKSQEADNKPRFKVGDKVIVSHFKKVGVVREIKSHPCLGFNYEVETGKDSYFIVHEVGVEPYAEPEYRNLSQEIANYDKSEDNQLKDNAQQNSWDEDFKKMNECFEKIQKTLSSLCDTFGKLEANVNKLNRL